MTQKIYELAEFRCAYCGKLLMKQAITLGTVELKCTNNKCNRIVTFSSGYQEDQETSKICELQNGKWYVKT